MTTLSDEQLEQYRTDGYVVLGRILSDDDLADLLAEERRFRPVEGFGASTNTKLLVAMQLCDRSEPIRRISTQGGHLAMVAQLLGPNVCLTHNQMLTKLPDDEGVHSDIPYHQDSGYGQLEPLDEDVTVWVAVTGHDAEQRLPAHRARVARRRAGRPRRGGARTRGCEKPRSPRAVVPVELASWRSGGVHRSHAPRLGPEPHGRRAHRLLHALLHAPGADDERRRQAGARRRALLDGAGLVGRTRLTSAARAPGAAAFRAGRLWADPTHVAVNRLPMRSPLVPYPDAEAARAGGPSPWVQRARRRLALPPG